MDDEIDVTIEYEPGNKVGRPIYWTTERIEEMAEKFEAWLENPTSVHYERFCFENKISCEYLSRWSKKNLKFNQAYKRAKEWQRMRTWEGGLTKKFQPNVAMLLLSQLGVDVGNKTKDQTIEFQQDYINHLHAQIEKNKNNIKDD